MQQSLWSRGEAEGEMEWDCAPTHPKIKKNSLLQPVLLLLLPHVAAAAATVAAVAGRLLGQWLPAPLTFARAITTTTTNLKSNFIFLMECNQ